jgi:hypothetical protein
VTKKGVRYEHHYYIAPELSAHTGREVQLRLDPEALGRLYVYSLDDEYICMAQAPELTGIDRREIAAAGRSHQKRLMAEQAKERRALARRIKRDPSEAILEHRVAEAKQVTALPHRATPYSTPALVQHGRAARATDKPKGREVDSDRHAEFVASFDPTPTPIERHDPRRTYARWMRIAERIERGEPVSEDERVGLERYRQTPEHASMREFFEDFADQISIDEFG